MVYHDGVTPVAALVLSCALPSAAQVRALPEAPSAVVVPSFAPARLTAPALFPIASALTPFTLSAALPSPTPAAPPLPAAPVPVAAAPARPGPVVLTSLRELAVLPPDGGRAAAASFDGPRAATARVPEGMTGVEVHTAADAMSWLLRPKARRGLAELPPIDLFVYRDRDGGRFLALDLARFPEVVETLPGLKPHEIPTVRRILAVTRDVQVIVLENGLTPDLVVDGVVTEMKSIRGDGAAKEIARANAQLSDHIRRHSHAPGAVVLDIEGRGLASERIEADIAAALSQAPAVGFTRVHAFNGGRWETYAPDADGRFRLRPGLAPFGPDPRGRP